MEANTETVSPVDSKKANGTMNASNQKEENMMSQPMSAPSVGSLNIHGEAQHQNTKPSVIPLPGERKVMRTTQSAVMSVGSKNKDGKNVVNTQETIQGTDDVLVQFLNDYFGDCTKGKQVYRFIQKNYAGNIDEAIQGLNEKEGQKFMADALLQYEWHLHDIEQIEKQKILDAAAEQAKQAKQEAATMEASRPKKVRKDPIVKKSHVCGVCGEEKTDCITVEINHAKVLCCPGCQNLRDTPKKLEGKDRFEFLCRQADIDPSAAQMGESGYPTITVNVRKGMPLHPVRSDVHLRIPQITNEERMALNGTRKAVVRIMDVDGMNVIIRFIEAVKAPVKEEKFITARIYIKETIKPQSDPSVPPVKKYRVHAFSQESEKWISIPKQQIEKILENPKELTGFWKMRVIKEADDFIFAEQVEKALEFQTEKKDRESFFAKIFYKNGSLHIEAANTQTRISIPRAKVDTIMMDRSQWGMWRMEVIKKTDEYIFAEPVQLVDDKDVPDCDTPNMFFATVRVYDGRLRIDNVRNKRVTVPNDSLDRLRYGLGVWKMRVLDEGDNFIFSKPIERVQNDGKEGNIAFTTRMNELRTKGKIEL